MVSYANWQILFILGTIIHLALLILSLTTSWSEFNISSLGTSVDFNLFSYDVSLSATGKTTNNAYPDADTSTCSTSRKIVATLLISLAAYEFVLIAIVMLVLNKQIISSGSLRILKLISVLMGFFFCAYCVVSWSSSCHGQLLQFTEALTTSTSIDIDATLGLGWGYAMLALVFSFVLVQAILEMRFRDKTDTLKE